MLKDIWVVSTLLISRMQMEKLLLPVIPMFSFWETRNLWLLFQKEMVFTWTFCKRSKREKKREEKQANDRIDCIYNDSMIAKVWNIKLFLSNILLSWQRLYSFGFFFNTLYSLYTILTLILSLCCLWAYFYYLYVHNLARHHFLFGLLRIYLSSFLLYRKSTVDVLSWQY